MRDEYIEPERESEADRAIAQNSVARVSEVRQAFHDLVGDGDHSVFWKSVLHKQLNRERT